MFDLSVAIAIGIYLVSLIFSVYMLRARKFGPHRPLAEIAVPVMFLLVVALYVLPLSVRSVYTVEAEGDISPYIKSFAGYIPVCLLLTTCFNLSFGFFYSAVKPVALPLRSTRQGLTNGQFGMIFALVILSLGMLEKLGESVGGTRGLILSGYRVTEVFADAGHYAVAFDWLIALSVSLLVSAFISGSRRQLYLAIAMLLTLAAMFLIMGRRAVLVVLLGSVLYSYHVAYKPLTLVKLSLIGLGAFFLLNLVGLLRGDSYDNLQNAIALLHDRKKDLGYESPSWFYVLSTGNFAVPFETFPQIVRSMGEKYLPGSGFYSFKSLSLIVPSFVWPDRPLPLANWYMEAFYGPTPKSEGRQFFFLSEAYMNFGPFGMIVWGWLMARVMRWLAAATTYVRSEPTIGAAVALLTASMLNFVSSDLVGFMVVFAKEFGVPLLALFIVKKIAPAKERSVRV